MNLSSSNFKLTYFSLPFWSVFELNFINCNTKCVIGTRAIKKNNNDYQDKSLKDHLLLFDSKSVSKQFVKLVQEVIDEK